MTRDEEDSLVEAVARLLDVHSGAVRCVLRDLNVRLVPAGGDAATLAAIEREIAYLEGR